MEIKKGDFIPTGWNSWNEEGAEVMGFAHHQGLTIEDKIICRIHNEAARTYEWAVGTAPKISNDGSELFWDTGEYYTTEDDAQWLPKETGVKHDLRECIAIPGEIKNFSKIKGGKNKEINIYTQMNKITSPIMLREGTEIASIVDKESGISGSIWVSDGYDSMMHFVDFQGTHYTDWDSFPNELQEAIRNDPEWKKNLGFKEGANLQEGCFDLMFNDKEGNILIDDTVEVAGLTDEELEGCLKGALTSAKALEAQKKTYDKGEIRSQADEEAFTTKKAPATLDDLKEPQTRDEAVRAFVDSLMKGGKSVDDIDEMFSQIKMTAIRRAEKLERENPQAMKGDGRI